jgi:hypothetical protein
VKQLQALLYKEWRDQRVLLIGGLAACLLMVVLAELLGGRNVGPLVRVRFVLPGLLTAFTLVLATESIVRDVQSGVEGTLLRLPVPRGRAWSAKFLSVALASVAFFVLLTLLEMLLRLSEHHSAIDGLFAMLEPTWWWLNAAVAAACGASACVVRRSLPAAFLGLALVSGIPLIAMALPDGHAREWLDVLLNSWTPAALSALACGAFLLGSFLAYRVRRFDALGIRRAASVAMGAGLILVPILAGTAHAQSWAFDILPFSKTAEIQWISPSPDGRFLAVQARQHWYARDNWIQLSERETGSRQRSRYEVWILDLTTGDWKEIDDRYREISGVDDWSASGTLLTASTNGQFGDGEVLVERVDPRTGRIVSSHPNSVPEDLGQWYAMRSLGSDTVLRWKANGRELRLPNRGLMRPSTQPGVVFHESDGFLVRHELAPDTTTRLIELGTDRVSLVRVSPDGRFLYLVNANTSRILDASTGVVVHDFGQGPPFADWPRVPRSTALLGVVVHALEHGPGFADWSRVPGRIALLCAGRMVWTALLEDGSLVQLPVQALRCLELGPDRLLAFDERHIERMRLDGSERVTLYEAKP